MVRIRIRILVCNNKGVEFMIEGFWSHVCGFCGWGLSIKRVTSVQEDKKLQSGFGSK